MKGSIRERSPGHWAIILDQRDPGTGKRKRKWHSFAGTKRQAQIECARLISEMSGGGHVDLSKATVLQFIERWLTHIRPNVTPKTHERYSDLLKKNLAPLLRAKILSKLQPIDISEAYAKALESGRRDGKGGLSPRTVHHVHRVLYTALNQAERWRLINRNPAALLEKRDRPKIDKKAGQDNRRSGYRCSLRRRTRAPAVHSAYLGHPMRNAARRDYRPSLALH